MYNVITVIKDCLGFVVNYINVNAVLLTCSHQNSLVDTSVTWKMNWMKPQNHYMIKVCRDLISFNPLSKED